MPWWWWWWRRFDFAEEEDAHRRSVYTPSAYMYASTGGRGAASSHRGLGRCCCWNLSSSLLSPEKWGATLHRVRASGLPATPPGCIDVARGILSFATPCEGGPHRRLGVRRRASVAATCVYSVTLSGFAPRTSRRARVHLSCPPFPLAFFPLVYLPRICLPPGSCPWAAPSRTRRWHACKPSSAPRTPRRTSAPPSSVLKGMKIGHWTGCSPRPRGRRRAVVPAVREGG